MVQGIQNIRVRSTQYTLNSAAVHRERRPAHYTAYVRTGAHRYTVFDDTVVSEKIGEFGMEWTPYVLFYEKVVGGPCADLS